MTMRAMMCRALLGALICLGLSGCAGPVVQTSRHLRSGELNVAGSIDIPGATAIPRVSGEVMYGLGDRADLSLHLGTTLLSYHAGLGARAYLGDRFTFAAQATWVQVAVGDFGALTGWLQTGARLTTATDAEWPVYGGLSGLAMFSNLNDDPFGFYSANAGLVGGFERRLSPSVLVQIELTLAPLMIGRDGVALFPGVSTGDNRFSPFVAQLSAALHWGWHPDDDKRKAPQPKPTEDRPGEQPAPDHLRPQRRDDAPAQPTPKADAPAPTPQRPPS